MKRLLQTIFIFSAVLAIDKFKLLLHYSSNVKSKSTVTVCGTSLAPV